MATYSVYDFINNEIPEKLMRFGWEAKVNSRTIELNYTMLNFDWKSLEFLGNDAWNLFLVSKSFQNYKHKIEKSKKRLGRLHFDAYSIDSLKFMVEEAKMEIDIDKLLAKKREKKSRKIIDDIAEKEKIKAKGQVA